MRPSREILAILVVVVLAALAWTVHAYVIDPQLSTAPDEKALQQNPGGTAAPAQQVAPAGTNGNPSEPTAPANGSTQN